MLEYEFGYAVIDTILNGHYDSRGLEHGDTSITFYDLETGLRITLEVADGIEVDFHEESGLDISGTVTGMTVVLNLLEEEPTTLLTADDITHELTLDSDIFPMRETMDSSEKISRLSPSEEVILIGEPESGRLF